MNAQAQGGDWRVTRRFRLREPLTPASAEALRAALLALSGVSEVLAAPGRSRIRVRYDLTLNGIDGIAATLAELGLRPPESGWERLRDTWLRQLEANARSNAGAPPPACCNRVPGGFRRR